MDHRLPVLMGRRVLLREPTAADGDAIFAYTSDPAVTRFLAFDTPRNLEETQQFIARCEQFRRQDREYVFVIADRASDAVRGVTALRHLDHGVRTAQVGTWIRREDWGNGVNLESKALLLDYAFETLGLHRIEARVSLDNHRSQRTLIRIGAQREGVLRQSFYKAGAFHDQVLYAILADDWRQNGGGAALLQKLPDAGAAD